MAKDNTIIYNEIQRMKQAWIWLVLSLISLLIFSYGLFSQSVLKKPWGNEPIDNDKLIIIAIIVSLFLLIMYFVFKGTRLITQIKTDGIYLSYPPYFKKPVVYSFDEIQDFRKRKYKVIKEFGSNGVQKRPKKKEIAYTVFGNDGIELILTSGYKILIGTQRGEYFLSSLRKAKGGKR